MLPIRVLHLADIHIGMETYGRLDPETGINGRVMDFLRRLSDVVDYAVDHEIDLVIFAGDAYKNQNPNPTYQREFARRMKRFADAGIPVVMLVGNHDLPAVARRASSIDIFRTLDVAGITVAMSERLYQLTARRGQVVQVATVPYPLRSMLFSRDDYKGKSIEELDRLLTEIMAENIRALAAQASQQPDLPTILVGHFNVSEAKQGSEQSVMIGRDVVVLKSVLADATWDYVALGHVHKHQELNGGAHPPIVYSGSLERIDFGEEDEEKGFVVVEVTRGHASWEFVPGYRRRARRFVTVRVDAREASDPTQAVLDAIAARDVREAVVRIVVRLRQDQEESFREREVRRALNTAYFVAPISKQVDRLERQRLGNVA
ncbi:MAG TPA: exonuclease SbcCD subunit D, partial [Anaerolineae bacterium]|nr:exonuclease SbcCD subunit D [Anaerolineae bacterium]